MADNPFTLGRFGITLMADTALTLSLNGFAIKLYYKLAAFRSNISNIIFLTCSLKNITKISK